MFARLLNSLVNRLRHHRWRWNVRKYFVDLEQVRVDHPVFLLGTQGGGLTLISRVLRRHPSAVSVTGGSKFWTGSDEMQNVLADALPEDLKLRGHPALDGRERQEAWVYATDNLLPRFRRTAEDATEELAGILLRRIREILLLYGQEASDLRFVDKSQSYTLKVSFLSRLLENHEPRFLLVVRNPYALCYRAMRRVLTGLGLSESQRLKLAVQHWDNSIRTALTDGEERKGFGVVRFEDFLRDPEETLQEIDSVVEMGLNPDQLPSADDELPLGTPPDGKWHPLRPTVNEKYLKSLSAGVVEAVNARCADLVDRFGYTPQGP